jgi:hypothetical protein
LSILVPIAVNGATVHRDLDILTLDEDQKVRHFLVVELHDCTNLGPKLLYEIQNEVASIFSRAGLGILWVDGSRDIYSVTDRPHEARVYIRPQHTKDLELHENHMGCVLSDTGARPGPVIHISRRSVEKLISSGKDSFPPYLARALSRVIAHELSHRFLQDAGHTKRGILKPRFSRGELIQAIPKGLHFSARQAAFIRSYAPTIRELQATLATADP